MTDQQPLGFERQHPPPAGSKAITLIYRLYGIIVLDRLEIDTNEYYMIDSRRQNPLVGTVPIDSMDAHDGEDDGEFLRVLRELAWRDGSQQAVSHSAILILPLGP